MMSPQRFCVVMVVLFSCRLMVADARGGGRGGGGRGGRGRTSAAGFIQRGNPKWKPNPSQESRAFEWSKVTRFIAKLFGAGAVKSANSNSLVYKGYQGAYKPQNVYHPKKPRPQGPPPAYPGLEKVPIRGSAHAPPPYSSETTNNKPLLYAAIFYHSTLKRQNDNYYYDYSHVDKNQAPTTTIDNNNNHHRDSFIILQQQPLNEWIESDVSTLPTSELPLEQELLKLPFYGQKFTNWTTELS